MPDLRLEPRSTKRLSVKFGYDKLEHTGYTCNVSSCGFFLESRIVYKTGVELNCELTTRKGEIVLLEGRVQWSKNGAMRHNHIMKSGMGIYILKFLQGEEAYLALHDLRVEPAVSLQRVL